MRKNKKANTVSIPTKGKHFGQARMARKKRAKRLRLYIILSLTLALFTGLIYMVFNAEFLKITSFTVNSAADIDHRQLIKDLRIEVSKTALGSIFGSSHYLSWPSSIANPPAGFVSIEIEKHLGSPEITINAQARKKFGLWCQETGTDPEFSIARCFWIDSTGLIFKEGPMSGGQLVPAIYESDRTAPLQIGQQVIDQSTFNVIRNVISGIRPIGLSYGRIEINKANQELRVYLNNGPEIIFSLRFDPSKSALPALAKLKEEGRLEKMQSIDLSVENRAFYK